MIKQRIKRKYYIIITTLLILFFTFFLIDKYTKKANPKIIIIANQYFDKEINNNLTNLSKNIVNDNTLERILQIYKNSEGEILYVDYNMENTYKLLDKISNKLKEMLDSNAYPNNGIILKLPVFIETDSIFFTNLGPKITVKINYVNSILTNVYTKITNYGLNNALVEAYIKISIDGLIITPVSSDKIKTEYDMLISSKIINGRIPEFYGNYLTSNSSIFDVPIKN